MLRWLREIYARIRMGTMLYTNDYDDRAELVAGLLLDLEWVKLDTYYGKARIELSNGAIVTIWDANRYYSWLMNGEYVHKGHVIWWEHERPSIYTMYLLRNKMNREIHKLVNIEGELSGGKV